MCGLAGFIDFAQLGGPEALTQIVAGMNARLVHRGPDDGGVWVGAEERVALGHRRLSIIDLSAEGRQPMASACGRYVIVFNGEIYNYRSLRRLLEADGSGPWRGHSDTEVMLAAIERWGVSAAVSRFVGMFAFALWDRQERTLHLGRDRMGEKPLYYGWVDGAFLFGSELKALMAHPNWQGNIDREALALFIKYSYVPAPRSIFAGFFKVLPGTVVSINKDELSRYDRTEPLPPQRYWSLRQIAEDGARNPFRGDDEDAVCCLKDLLQRAIRQQMLADVPLGAFLSGGIDSSTVVAMMQAQSSTPVRTFTVGFDEKDYNEADHAKAVAHHLGTEHTELYVTSADALAVIPKLPFLYDEPFADASQIPTYLVAQMAGRHVTVSLSGDAGDELFAGYGRYFFAQRIWEGYRKIPLCLRRTATRTFKAIPATIVEAMGQMVQSKFGKLGINGQASDALRNLFAIWATNDPEHLYAQLVSIWKAQESVVLNADAPESLRASQDFRANLAGFFERMMYLDQTGYLPDDILVKLDRAAMGVSLETRVPFLDHRIVEFAWTVPLSMKVRAGKGKWLLRQLLYKYVPPEMIERPKMGFGLPIEIWLRGPLRDWAESLLTEQRLQSESFFDSKLIRNKWTALLSGQSRVHHYRIWNVLMFQSWLDAHKSKVTI